MDGAAAMVAAAVRAAVLAKAPRRTVSAVAAAVATALARSAAPAAVRRPNARVPTEATSATGASPASGADGFSPEELLAALRSARTSQRRRKKLRRRATKLAGRTTEQQDVEAAEQPQVPALGGALVPSLPTASVLAAAPCVQPVQQRTPADMLSPALPPPVKRHCPPGRSSLHSPGASDHALSARASSPALSATSLDLRDMHVDELTGVLSYRPAARPTDAMMREAKPPAAGRRGGGGRGSR
jgi:hypothetical protein